MMKKPIAFLAALAIFGSVFAQSATRTSTTATSLNAPAGNRSWNAAAPNFAAGVLNNGNRNTHYLYFSNFGFTLPANISVNSLSVTFSRSSSASAVDSAIRLVIGGSVYYGSSGVATNASSGSTWPPSLSSTTVSFGPTALTALTSAILQNANFGIAIAARFGGSNTNVTIGPSVTVALTYTTLAPIILTDFSVNKNNDNHVELRFATSSEENVDRLFIERSADGRNFEKIFTITPRGARNVYTRYFMTDKTPLQGNNYYRISEVDKNGRWYYYITKLVNVSTKGSAFNAYYDGSQVIANISSMPGQYEVMLTDLSGIPLSRRTVDLRSGGSQIRFDAPGRTGIYLVNVRGTGFNEVSRVAVTK